jgi:uncharacterized protein
LVYPTRNRAGDETQTIIQEPVAMVSGAEEAFGPESFRRFVQSILPYATAVARASRIHGTDHWERVALAGMELAEETAGADPLVVWLFAGIHDSRRLSDRFDPHHGRRAALLAKELRDVGLFEVDDNQMALLEHALEFHADGHVSKEPTIGACWDADRLDLGRCKITPDPTLLSTEAAKELLAARRQARQAGKLD